MRLEEKMKKWKTIKDIRCLRCGNPWWFDKPEVNEQECTTCQAQITKKHTPEPDRNIQ